MEGMLPTHSMPDTPIDVASGSRGAWQASDTTATSGWNAASRSSLFWSPPAQFQVTRRKQLAGFSCIAIAQNPFVQKTDMVDVNVLGQVTPVLPGGAATASSSPVGASGRVLSRTATVWSAGAVPVLVV